MNVRLNETSMGVGICSSMNHGRFLRGQHPEIEKIFYEFNVYFESFNDATIGFHVAVSKIELWWMTQGLRCRMRLSIRQLRSFSSVVSLS